MAPIPFPLPNSPSLYHPAPELAELREQQPVAQVHMPDGKTAWLVTRIADVRQVLIDPRFSRAAAADPDAPQTELSGLINDSMLGMDPPEHTRLRKLVASAFTARRIEALRPRVVALVNELLDAMEKQDHPVDLVEHFSLPMPVQVICELLGCRPAIDTCSTDGRTRCWATGGRSRRRRRPRCGRSPATSANLSRQSAPPPPTT